MNNYLLPTDDIFVEEIAKAIARNRILVEAEDNIVGMIGFMPNIEDKLEAALEPVFTALWEGKHENDEYQRNLYREDAKSAIAAINLKLLTLSE